MTWRLLLLLMRAGKDKELEEIHGCNQMPNGDLDKRNMAIRLA
jgi:hypothetical protein